MSEYPHVQNINESSKPHPLTGIPLPTLALLLSTNLTSTRSITSRRRKLDFHPWHPHPRRRWSNRRSLWLRRRERNIRMNWRVIKRPLLFRIPFLLQSLRFTQIKCRHGRREIAIPKISILSSPPRSYLGFGGVKCKLTPQSDQPHSSFDKQKSYTHP